MFPVSVPRIFKNAGRASVANFYILQLCACVGMFREVPLLSQSTSQNATKKRTRNYISGNVLWKLLKISRKSSVMEFLFSELQAYKLQPSALRTFKIQEINKITSTVTFLFLEAGVSREVFCKKRCSKVFAKCTENTCTGVSFSIKLQASGTSGRLLLFTTE